MIGGAELKGKNQAVELKLALNTDTPGGRNLVTMLESALKEGAKPGSAGGEGEIKLDMLLADAGGNIAVIGTSVRAP